MNEMIEDILENYNIPGKIVEIKQNNVGNINKTYIIKYFDKNKEKKYIIQKINTSVFNEPYKLMNNIDSVTTYLKNKMEKEQDKEHRVIEIIKTANDKLLCDVNNEYKEKDYYRMYGFIDNSVSYDYSVDNKVVYNTGKAFGNFNKLLNDYPIDELEETIKDFHNTEKRFQKLLSDIEKDPKKRVANVYKEIVEIIKRHKICSLITKSLDDGTIPYRVTHNDTKVNNVMMNKDTGDYLAVIDLDTVMPGSLLFDYGDGIRSTSSTALEDEIDLSKVGIDLKMFESYTDGYMSEMANYITREEVNLMAESVRIITLELCIRFLNDYINGDTYFKVDYKNHNLDRTRNQLALVKDIENKLSYMKEYIEKSYKKNKTKEKELKKVLY